MREQAKQDPRLIQIVNYGRQVNAFFRDALWSIDPKIDKLENLVDRCIEIGSASVEGTAFALIVDRQNNMPDLFLSPSQKHNILMILHEALNNVLKNSNGDTIQMDFRVDHNRLRLSICDNGFGTKSTADENGYGIRSMKQRAKRINGEIRFTNTESWFCVELIV
jgi:signal transduction histidine kinase